MPERDEVGSGSADDGPTGDTADESSGEGSVGDGNDPFANLVLDDAFVSGATVYEAPARSRLAVARFATDKGTGLPNPPNRTRDDQPHQAFVTGAATMPDTANGGPPTEATFDANAQPLCEDVAAQYLGPTSQPSATTRVGWRYIHDDSWQAGSRRFTCTVVFLDPTGGPRSETGAHPGGPVDA